MNTTTIVSLILFLLTYVLIFSMEKYRPHIAVASALIFVLLSVTGILPDFDYGFREALTQVDWNVLLMIAGTMGTVQLFIESAMPQRMSDIVISKVPNTCWMVVMISLFAGIVSAFVDNVATVLMIAPVAMAICRKLNIAPAPVIFCISISSNLQGAATLVGDTTSILLAKAANLDFMDFFFLEGKPGMFFITEAGALVCCVLVYFLFRKEKDALHVEDKSEVKDMVPSWLLLLTVLSLIAVSFIPYKDAAAPGQFYKPEITNGLICMFYFLVGIVRRSIKDGNIKEARRAIRELDYYTILLLTGLFVVIGAIKKAGIIDLLAELILKLCGGGIQSKKSMLLAYLIIVWMSVAISAFIDNIPYVATMLPVVEVLTLHGMASDAFPFSPYVLYFGLLVGATLGGNLTPVGASANIAGIGILRKEGVEVQSSQFMKYSVPMTLSAVITGSVLVWLIFMPGFFG